jgi:DNA-binding NtrC family response regulator
VFLWNSLTHAHFHVAEGVWMIRLLSFGCDETVLRAHPAALENAGIRITSVENEAEARALLRGPRFDVVMIGRDVPLEARNNIARLGKSRRKAGVIFLYRGCVSQAESADALLTADISTEDLVSTIERLARGTAGPSRLSRTAV